MKKVTESHGTILVGVILVMSGLGLLVLRQLFLTWVIEFLAIIILLLAGLQLIRVLIRVKRFDSIQDLFGQFLQSFMSMLLALWLINNPVNGMEIISNIIGSYLLLIGFINLISTVLLYRDHSPSHYWRAIYSIGHITLGILAFNLSMDEGGILLAIGFYVILIGFTYIQDGLSILIEPEDNVYLRRRIRFSVPVVFHALLPKRLLDQLAVYLKEGSGEYQIDSEIVNHQENVLQVIFSTSPKRIDLMGHINICYNNIIYSYGNHDVDSRSLFDSIGDGVLVTVEKERYYQFTLEEGTTIVEYDIPLMPVQQVKIGQRLKRLMSDVVLWTPKSITQHASYGGRLRRATNAKMHKFNKGKYQTYFIFGTNCVLLADDIIGSIGMDSFVMAAMLTPATYYDFFEKEFKKQGSRVTKRRILQRVDDLNTQSIIY